MRSKTQLQLLLAIFFLSGFSSLIYQVAWQRILTLYYSVENVSITLIVTVFLFGLGVGSITGGYLAERIRHKLVFYLCIELLIGLFGLFSIPLLGFLGRGTAGSEYGMSFIYMFAFLSLPTILMGMTLPLLTKIFNSYTRNFLKSVSKLYFINTLGAALGCVFTSYILISFFGLDTSVYVAAGINLVIVISILIFKNNFKENLVEAEEKAQTGDGGFSTGMVCLIVFITGFIAVGYEIIWFRIIGSILKATPYAFSSILFIYLVGIALGSRFINRYLQRHQSIDKKNLFFKLQFSIAFFVLFSFMIYYYLVQYTKVFNLVNMASFVTFEHPYLHWPRTDTAQHFFKDLFNVIDVILWPFIFIFLPTFFMGASFPLVTSFISNKNKEGFAVGKVYFFNVIGNVFGGLVTGFILLATWGTEYSILLLSCIGFLFFLFVKSKHKLLSVPYKIMFVATIIFFSLIFFPEKSKLTATIHLKTALSPEERQIITEGIDGTVVTYSYEEKLNTYINGMGHGGRPNPHFYFEAIETCSFKEKINKVLVIGFGTGTTVETILKLTPKPQITLVELNRTLIKNLTQVDYLKHILENEKVNLIYADGRKFLYNDKEKYDLIFMDPLYMKNAYSNNLYSKECFELIKNRLVPGGAFMMWIDEYKVVPKTLATVFPDVNQYSYFCITSNRQLVKDTSFHGQMFSHFSGYEKELLLIQQQESKPLNRQEILGLTKNYPINQDYKPRSEYYIGLKIYD